MNDDRPTTRILLIDPDVEHARRVMSEAAAFREPVEIVPVTTVAAAAEALGGRAFDATTLGLELGEDAASEVVGEIERRYPGLPVVAVASRLDDHGVAAACRLGAAAILVRPFDIDALMQVLRAPAMDAGFPGSCTGVPTALMLTLHCHSGADGVLHLFASGRNGHPDRMGSIVLEGGQPVHATAGALTGSEAVHAMLSWHDAEASWLPGHTRCARTIVGRWEGLLARSQAPRQFADGGDIEQMVAVAYPDVVEKLSRLSQTPDVLGAFLLRHAEVVAGRCATEIDEQLASRALCRLAHVFFDVEAQPSASAGREIQAIVGSLRLVLDRIGPDVAGFQVGVLVRQAAPVCKSLRRLLRQIDSAFTRSLKAAGRQLDKARPAAGDPERSVQWVA